MSDGIEKVSIIISKGSLEGIYPGLIMANGARAEGIDANLSFTFFGLDAIHAKQPRTHQGGRRREPGMHMASLIGVLPRMSAIATHMIEKKMDDIDIPDLPEFMEMIADTGCGMFACKASVDSSASPKTISSARSRTASRSVSSTTRLPAGRSSSRDEPALPTAQTYVYLLPSSWVNGATQ